MEIIAERNLQLQRRRIDLSNDAQDALD